MSGSNSSQPVRSAKSTHRRASHWIRQAVRTRSDVGEDQMRDPLGPSGGERKSRAASQGKADNRDLVEAESIDDACEVAGEMSARVTGGVVRGIAMAVAALVVSDDRTAIGQFPPLVK